MRQPYLVESWQGFLQQTVFLVSRGYHHYCLTRYPESKKERWTQIDRKLIGKYQTDKNRFQRARQKNKGLRNYYFFRWGNLAILMHTAGGLPPDVMHDDLFRDCRNKAERLLVAFGTVSLWVMPPEDPNNSGRTTVRMSREFYREFKNGLLEVAKRRDRRGLIYEFNKINGFPAWAGMIAQKKRLADFVIRTSRKHEIWPAINRDELRLVARRKPVPDWK